MPSSTAAADPGPRPLPPEQGECCRGDCGPHCVFAVYERALEHWQQAQVETPHPDTEPRR